jgi:hypothetical protein
MGTHGETGEKIVSAEKLEKLMRRASRAPRDGSEEAPPFFAQRVTARWLSVVDERERSPWEIFALRGAALSAAVMLLALALNASLSASNDEGDPDFTAEVFLLP